MNIKKARLTYLGFKADKTINKNQQFSVEITAEELNRIKTFPFPQTFTGKVVSTGKTQKQWVIGDVSPNFCNPFYEFYKYYVPTWHVQICTCEGSFHNDNCPLRVN